MLNIDYEKRQEALAMRPTNETEVSECINKLEALLGEFDDTDTDELSQFKDDCIQLVKTLSQEKDAAPKNSKTQNMLGMYKNKIKELGRKHFGLTDDDYSNSGNSTFSFDYDDNYDYQADKTEVLEKQPSNETDARSFMTKVERLLRGGHINQDEFKELIVTISKARNRCGTEFTSRKSAVLDEYLTDLKNAGRIISLSENDYYVDHIGNVERELKETQGELKTANYKLTKKVSKFFVFSSAALLIGCLLLAWQAFFVNSDNYAVLYSQVTGGQELGDKNVVDAFRNHVNATVRAEVNKDWARIDNEIFDRYPDLYYDEGGLTRFGEGATGIDVVGENGTNFAWALSRIRDTERQIGAANAPQSGNNVDTTQIKNDGIAEGIAVTREEMVDYLVDALGFDKGLLEQLTTQGFLDLTYLVAYTFAAEDATDTMQASGLNATMSPPEVSSSNPNDTAIIKQLLGIED